MSIKGLTDRGFEFPQIGVIRKGAPKGEHAPGKDLDYFRVVFDEMEHDAMTAFVADYGQKPTEIRILLPFDDIERCWDAYVEAYTAGGLIYRGDGKQAIFWLDPETGEVKVKDGQPYTACIGVNGLAGYYVSGDGSRQKIQAKAVGRLRVIIPSLKRLAYLLVVTSSKWDVMHLSDQLGALKAVNGGRLAGIPMMLRRRPKQVSIPLKGKRARVTKWLLSVEAEPTWVAAQIDAMQRAALPEGTEIFELPAGPVIDNPTNGNDDQDAEFDENVGDMNTASSHEPLNARVDEERKASDIDDYLPQTAGPNQKTATVANDATGKWNVFCESLASRFPHYAGANGKPNKFHIGAVVVKFGVGMVTLENLPKLMGKIEQYAKENHSAQ